VIVTVAEAKVLPASVATLPLMDEVVVFASVAVDRPAVKATANAILLSLVFIIFPDLKFWLQIKLCTFLMLRNSNTGLFQEYFN